jgi:hypothetical protein
LVVTLREVDHRRSDVDADGGVEVTAQRLRETSEVEGSLVAQADAGLSGRSDRIVDFGLPELKNSSRFQRLP